jgi:hypothetical protein
MVPVLVALIQTIWLHLDEITMVLRFCTALIGFIVAVSLGVRRLRRWRRRRLHR